MDETLLTVALSVVTDQFKVLKNGNVAGNVYRLLADEPVPLYDSPTSTGHIMRRITPGSLVVGFSDPGTMRQINTADQFFGYIKRDVTLLPVQGLDADGLYDPEKRAALEATLPPMDVMRTAYAAQQSRTKRDQYLFMMGLALFALLCMATVLLHSPAAPVK